MSKYYNAVLRINLSDPDKAKSVLDSLSEALDETGVPKEKYLAEFKETVGDKYREAKSLIRNLLKRDYGLSFPKRHPMSETEIGLLGCILTAVLHTEPESVEEWCFSIFEKDAMPGSVVGFLYVTRHGSSFYEPKTVLELIRNDSPVASVCKRSDDIEEENEDLSSSIVDAVNNSTNKWFAETTDDVDIIVSFLNYEKHNKLRNENIWLSEEVSDRISAKTLKSLLILNKRTNGALAKLLRSSSGSDKWLDREIDEYAASVARQADAASNERLKESLSRRLWDKHLSQVLANEKAWLDKTLKENADVAERQTKVTLCKQTEEVTHKNIKGTFTLEIPLSVSSLFKELVESIISDKNK